MLTGHAVTESIPPAQCLSGGACDPESCSATGKPGSIHSPEQESNEPVAAKDRTSKKRKRASDGTNQVTIAVNGFVELGPVT